MKHHLKSENYKGMSDELELAYKADPQSACVNLECGRLMVAEEEWLAGYNYLCHAIANNNQQNELHPIDLIDAFKMLCECSSGLDDENLAYAYASVAITLFGQHCNAEEDEDIMDEIMEVIPDEEDVDENIVEKYINAMQTSFPQPGSIK